MTRGKITLWIAAPVLFGVGLVAALFFHFYSPSPVSLNGAITAADADTWKQVPIADVEVTEAQGLAVVGVKSDSTGFFSITLRPSIRRGHAIILRFRHPAYRPLDVREFAGDKLYLIHMVPAARPRSEGNQPALSVGNVRVRYSIKDMRAVNIGSAVKTFQIENTGNVACKGQGPCSPDGRWKAATASASLDAGLGNEFRDARASCIAGPCPFTKIESDGFSKGGQSITVSARNWSDTATFLLEAEVFHPMVSEIGHESYPVIFGRSLNYTLPATAEGVSIEADINGQTVIFPLGPALFLSWADCNARVNADQTKVYRCNLKPGYEFH
jgi:hypothetical protein